MGLYDELKRRLGQTPGGPITFVPGIGPMIGAVANLRNAQETAGYLSTLPTGLLLAAAGQVESAVRPEWAEDATPRARAPSVPC